VLPQPVMFGNLIQDETPLRLVLSDRPSEQRRTHSFSRTNQFPGFTH
jgi:hypothetical protein